LTAVGSEATFRAAGELGANLLTNLLGQSVDDLAQRIQIYRRAWREHGHGPGAGHVTLMLHTFVGEDPAAVRETVRQPFCRYLKSHFDLVRSFAQSIGYEGRLTALSDADLDALLEHAFDRYYETSGLLGTPDACQQMV